MSQGRLSKHSYFLVVAQAAALRSTCPRRRVGAVLVRNDDIVSTGYNGSPSGQPHCLDVGCLLNDSGRCIRTLHGEANAFRNGATGDTLYSTDQPCLSCLKIIISNGVRRVYYLRPYPDADRDQFIQAHGLEQQLVEFRAPTLQLSTEETP